MLFRGACLVYHSNTISGIAFLVVVYTTRGGVKLCWGGGGGEGEQAMESSIVWLKPRLHQHCVAQAKASPVCYYSTYTTQHIWLPTHQSSFFLFFLPFFPPPGTTSLSLASSSSSGCVMPPSSPSPSCSLGNSSSLRRGICLWPNGFWAKIYDPKPDQ